MFIFPPLGLSCGVEFGFCSSKFSVLFICMYLCIVGLLEEANSADESSEKYEIDF